MDEQSGQGTRSEEKSTVDPRDGEETVGDKAEMVQWKVNCNHENSGHCERIFIFHNKR
jgi:hypothetical protein